MLASAGAFALPSSAPAAPTGGASYDTSAGALTAKPAVLLGRTLHFRGTVAPGTLVRIERLDAKLGWVTQARARADAAGAYIARWRTDHIGRFTFRALTGEGAAASAAADAPTTRTTVYRPVVATWYGPGFFGNRMACGGRLSRSTMGVAHRTLPCGTLVDVTYAGRQVTVPVVDRGPFANGAEFDLTQAAARALGVDATVTVGAVRVRKP